jgi:hypothetical protein
MSARIRWPHMMRKIDVVPFYICKMYEIGKDNIVRWNIAQNNDTLNGIKQVQELTKITREYECKNLYVRSGDYTTVLYPVVRKDIKSAFDFPTTRGQLLYYELCGFQGVRGELRRKKNHMGFIISDNKCAFCCNLTDLYIDHCPESVFVCFSCVENTKPRRICINTRDNHESNTFSNLVNTRIDIMVADVNVGVNTLTSRGNNIIMLAHKTFKNCAFDYIANKTTSSYGYSKKMNCNNCGRFVKQSFSLCSHCDNYAYNVSFRSYVIMFWLINKCDIIGDVFAVIVSYVCKLNLYSITPVQLIARLNKIPANKEVVVNEKTISYVI